MVLIASAVKLVAEVALMALAGQWLLGWLTGSRRDANPFYRLLQVLTDPVVRAIRRLAPRAVLDSHLPLAAFLLLACVWLAATAFKIRFCLEAGVQTCR